MTCHAKFTIGTKYRTRGKYPKEGVMIEQEQIVKFLKNRGATKCAPGERAMSEHEMYRARHGTPPVEQRRLAVTDHLGREYWVNGLGERIT